MRLHNNHTLNYMQCAFLWPFCAFLCPLVTTPRGFLAQMVINEVTWLHGAVTHAVLCPVTSSFFATFSFGFIDASASGSRQVPRRCGTKQPPLHSIVEDVVRRCPSSVSGVAFCDLSLCLCTRSAAVVRLHAVTHAVTGPVATVIIFAPLIADEGHPKGWYSVHRMLDW